MNAMACGGHGCVQGMCRGGDEPVHTRDANWLGAPSFYGEQETLAGRSFTTSFIFGVETIMDYNSSLHIR
jgi:hypothetical protein